MDFNWLNDIQGLHFIPCGKNKNPLPTNWQTNPNKHDLSKCEMVGLVCGKLSGGIEAIDLDLKYDLTGNLYSEYRKAIHRADDTLLRKMVVQKTKSGGYHWIYRCSVLQGNKKLANRPTTEEEKEKTFSDSYAAAIASGSDHEMATKKAEKAKKADKVRVLIETRGEGGQIIICPTEGYELVFGDHSSIDTITPEQREILHTVAKEFNEYYEQHEVPASRMPRQKSDGLSSCDDYNQRGDVVALLQEHGWTFVKDRGSKSFLRRPGQTTAVTSGNFDHDKRWFSVFSTSTEFQDMKAYLPYAVFAILECNGDFNAAAKKLGELGYGDQQAAKDKKPAAESTRQIKSRVNPDDDDLSFLATSEDYDGYLGQVIDGTLPMGLTTGSPELDKHFLYKDASFVMTNGIDNTGKSVFTWWLLLLAAMYHDWCGIIFSSENTIGAFMRKMVQFYWGKPLRGSNSQTPEEYAIAKKFIESHFVIIKSQEDLFNYKDIINMVRKSRKSGNVLKRLSSGALNFGMIDPYNSLKIDLSGFSKLNTHEYHYEALSELKAYGQQTGFGWFINHHAVTAATRMKDGDKKYAVAPSKADTENGAKISNKADDFLTIHRITNHPTDWKITEVHVRKIKDTETGGRVTSLDQPVKFEMYRDGCGFIERHEFGFGIDPIEEWHRKRNSPYQHNVLSVGPSGDIFESRARTPYKDAKDENDEMPF